MFLFSRFGLLPFSAEFSLNLISSLSFSVFFRILCLAQPCVLLANLVSVAISIFFLGFPCSLSMHNLLHILFQLCIPLFYLKISLLARPCMLFSKLVSVAMSVFFFSRFGLLPFSAVSLYFVSVFLRWFSLRI